MRNFFKPYKRRVEIRTGQTWERILEARRLQKQSLQAVAAAQEAVQFAEPPLHEPHVIFEKSYLSDEVTGEAKRVSEELRHLSYHDHHAQQVAY